jgi:hypothetical protein
MLVEAAVILCLSNTTDAAVLGLVRDGRFKTTSAKLSGASMTYREPLAEMPLPPVAPGATGCASVDAVTLGAASLVVWSARPTQAAPEDRKDDATCPLPVEPVAGQRLTFVYRKSLLGQAQCKETR